MRNKDMWDTVLTDAIVETSGTIQPYDKILKFFYQKYHLKVIRLKKRTTKKEIMKYLPIISALIIFILLTVIFVGLSEMSSINRVQLKTIEGLREQNHFLLRRNGELQIENKTFRQALDSAKIIYK